MRKASETTEGPGRRRLVAETYGCAPTARPPWVTRNFRPRIWLLVAAAVAWLLPYGGAVRADPSATTLPDGAIAVVDGQPVAESEFELYLRQYLRSKLYHGGSKERLAELRGEALEQMIKHRLLVHEAEKRNLPGDPEHVNRQMKAIEDAYIGTANWPAVEQRLPKVRLSLLEDSKVEMLRLEITRVPEPEDAVLEDYYARNLTLFTEPERFRLSVILLGVDPSASSDEWTEARDRAHLLFQQLSVGADFAEFARQHSSHLSAKTGGDLGEVHNGQLSDPAQQAVDALKPGQVSEPVLVLEGYALFQLHERKPAEVKAFAEVRERAAALFKRHQAKRQWEEFVMGLRRTAEVSVRSFVAKNTVN